MKHSDANELTAIVEGALEKKDSIKDALEILHPKKEMSVSIKNIDRLGVLSDTQIDSIAVLEWQDKALSMSTKEFSENNVTEGFTDKIKALSVAKDGLGRTEVPGVMKPAIMGDMFNQGLMPIQSQSQQPQRRGFLNRLFGR